MEGVRKKSCNSQILQPRQLPLQELTIDNCHCPEPYNSVRFNHWTTYFMFFARATSVAAFNTNNLDFDACWMVLRSHCSFFNKPLQPGDPARGFFSRLQNDYSFVFNQCWLIYISKCTKKTSFGYSTLGKNGGYRIPGFTVVIYTRCWQVVQ